MANLLMTKKQMLKLSDFVLSFCSVRTDFELDYSQGLELVNNHLSVSRNVNAHLFVI